MNDNPIKDALHREIFRVRAGHFRTGAGPYDRVPKEYQEDPHLISADLAYTVMNALCAAEEAGVEIDLDGAVVAGRELFEEFMQQVRGQ